MHYSTWNIFAETCATAGKNLVWEMVWYTEEENASELQSHLAELQIKALEIFGEPVENEQLLEVCFY